MDSKMTSAQIKPTELQMLWKLVKAGEARPLTMRNFRGSACTMMMAIWSSNFSDLRMECE
jgi:hypothetical protein